MTEHDRTCPTCGSTFKRTAERVVLVEESNAVIIDSEPIQLTQKTFMLFEALWRAYPRVSQHDYLITSLYNLDEPEDAERVIRVFLNTLRKRFKDTSISFPVVWGEGYQIKLAELNQEDIAA